MLVFAGIELISFIVASIGLCFGFVLETQLIIQGCLVTAQQGLHRVKAFSASHPTPPVSRVGVHKKLEGTWLGQLTPTDQRDIPHLMTSCSAYKSGGRRRGGKRGGHSE